MLAVYSATKAFINQYSASVAYEAKAFGVDVLGVHPYYISGTGLYSAKKPSLNAPSPERIVGDCLACLGTTKNPVYPYFFHGIMVHALHPPLPRLPSSFCPLCPGLARLSLRLSAVCCPAALQIGRAHV